MNKYRNKLTQEIVVMQPSGNYKSLYHEEELPYWGIQSHPDWELVEEKKETMITKEEAKALFDKAKQICLLSSSTTIDSIKIDEDGDMYGIITYEWKESDGHIDIEYEQLNRPLAEIKEEIRIAQEKAVKEHELLLEEAAKRNKILQEQKDMLEYERLKKKFEKK